MRRASTGQMTLCPVVLLVPKAYVVPPIATVFVTRGDGGRGNTTDLVKLAIPVFGFVCGFAFVVLILLVQMSDRKMNGNE